MSSARRAGLGRGAVAIGLCVTGCAVAPTSADPAPAPERTEVAAEQPAEVSASPTARTLAPSEVREDLALLRETLERVHPGYRRYATDAELERAWAELAALAGADEDAEGDDARVSLDRMVLGVSRLLATLRCAHTVAELPPSLAELRAHHPSFLPFRFALVDTRMIVVSADPRQPARGRRNTPRPRCCASTPS